MNHKSKFKKRNVLQVIFLMPLFCLIGVSCNQKSGTTQNTESELINRINAVTNQMAKQGNISDEELLALKSLARLVGSDEDYGSQEDLKDAIAFDEVETVPVYFGCEGLSEKESKQCFNESFNSLVASEFNIEIPNNLGIQGPQSVEVFFMINKDGTISHIKVREPNVVILAEIARVLKLMPKFKPGTQNGETVKVLCTTIVHYGN